MHHPSPVIGYKNIFNIVYILHHYKSLIRYKHLDTSFHNERKGDNMKLKKINRSIISGRF